MSMKNYLVYLSRCASVSKEFKDYFNDNKLTNALNIPVVDSSVIKKIGKISIKKERWYFIKKWVYHHFQLK